MTLSYTSSSTLSFTISRCLRSNAKTSYPQSPTAGICMNPEPLARDKEGIYVCILGVGSGSGWNPRDHRLQSSLWTWLFLNFAFPWEIMTSETQHNPRVWTGMRLQLLLLAEVREYQYDNSTDIWYKGSLPRLISSARSYLPWPHKAPLYSLTQLDWLFRNTLQWLRLCWPERKEGKKIVLMSPSHVNRI